MSKNLPQLSSHPVATPGLDILYGAEDILAKPKRHTSFSPPAPLSDEPIEMQSPTPCLLKPPQGQATTPVFTHDKSTELCLWHYNLPSLFWEGLSLQCQGVKP